MKRNLITFILLVFSVVLFAQADKISVMKNSDGVKLVVNVTTL